ncbi:type III secretion system translocon subunit SctE [Bordetella sp. 02P26C-1]|uniref:type III secretion system translocon subunit SctE n=1 Tax=Bordetella sp. 02P26C-1 TaxID=2683195 RepID=UPI00135458A3|nr:type III secretion system translocon subunit SctE [Bordetella sp. 02P26C-1]MVW78577.1 YopB/SseC family type III secretion system translocon subunit [Bordetella sp. 02P26C-1]
MSIQSSSPLPGIIAEIPSSDVNGTLSDGVAQRDSTRGPFSAQSNARFLGDQTGLSEAPPFQSAGTAFDDGVTNARRAPSLYVPQGGMSPIDVYTRLSVMMADSANESTELVKANVAVTKEKQDRNFVSLLAKQQEAQAKAAEEAKSSRRGKIFGWIGKIAAFVGAAVAVVATVATAGAATPLLVASVVSLVSATLSLADQVSRELGGGGVSLSGALSKLTIGVLEAFGMDSDKAKSVSDALLDLAAPVLILLEPQYAGEIAARVCKALDLSPETTQLVAALASALAAVVVTVACVASVGAAGAQKLLEGIPRIANMLVRGVGAIAQGVEGGFSINTAFIRRDGDYIRADVAELKAENLGDQRQMKNDQEMLRFLLQTVQDGMQSASDVLRGVFDNLSQISNNIGRRETA